LAMLQEPATPPPPQTQESPAPPAQPAQQPNVRVVQLQLVTGELENKLDSTSARQGDSVVLKTRETVKTPDGTEIPKGSELVGHVINVRPHSQDAENAQITLQFDRAELKGGQSLPIESVLESVAPSSGESTMDNNNAGMAPVQPATGPAGSAPGANAPIPGAAANSPANNNGANQSAANDHPGLASGSTAQTPDQNAAANNTPSPGSIVARSGNVAIRTTSVPGVLLANNINGQPFSNASGMLLGARRDIKLDGGTQMVVAVAAAPQQGSGMPR
jgi:hypothetical protein